MVRVSGRGNHQTALALRRLFEGTSTERKCPHYIFDLEKCTTMDSTFMGVIAGMALRQRRARREAPTIVHLHPHVAQQLRLLGLQYIGDNP